MKKNKPMISIIMPAKNGSNYIEEALNAIKSQNVNIEIIVVDDGSTDNTAEIAERFGCIVLKHNTSKGPVVSKNTALKIAKGKYIMFHDHDDVLNENSISLMLKEIEEDKNIFAIMAKMQDFYSPELSKKEREEIIIREDSYFGLFSGAILIKKEVFDIVGNFNENIKAGEIIDWTGRMNKNNLSIKKLNIISANRRIHKSNFGRTNKGEEFKDYSAILRSKIKQNLQ